jgi:hypothetical protein
MKLVFSLLGVVLIFTSVLPLHAQTIKVGFLGAANFHLKNKPQQDENVPAFLQDNSEKPSVAMFFADEMPTGLCGMFEFPLRSGFKIQIGSTYEQGTLHNIYPGTENILGESLRLRTSTAFLGGSKPINDDETIFFFGTLGLAWKSYEGKSTLNNLQFVHHFEAGMTLRFNAGVEFEELFQSSLSLALGASFDLGSVNRGNIDIYQNNMKVGYGTPTGDINLKDQTISLRLAVFYTLRQSVLGDE